MARKDLSGLHRFLAVVDAGSLNKAAETLHISQPALTKSIQVLEQQLGVELFVRGARGVSLTSYGRAVHFRGRLIEAEVARLQDEVLALRDLTFGKVRIGAPPGPGFHTSTLPAATLRLIGAGRKLSVHISMGTREQLLPVLRQGALDFIVAVMEEGESSSDLVQVPLFEDRNAIMVHPNHPLLSQKAPGIEELATYPWFVMSESVALERSLRESAYAQGIALTQSIVHSDSSQFVKSAVVASSGIGLLRYQVTRKDSMQVRLVELQLEPGFATSQGMGRQRMGLIHRREAELSAASMQFMHEIQQGCLQDEDLVLPPIESR